MTKIKLNKKFYNLKILKKTKRVFKDLCKCSIKESKEYFNINFISKEKNIQFEFANYALSLIK